MTQWHRIRTRIGFVITLLVLLTAFASPTPALAATVCTDLPLDGVTIQGNLTVPNGFACILVGTTVTGNVTVGANATFESYGATIQGKVSGDGVYRVILGGGTVVKGSAAVSGAVTVLYIDSSRVNGNLTITGNATNGLLTVTNSSIGGNLTVSGNTGATPSIEYNTIGGNLSCDGNTPAPDSFGNVVSGRKSGQCAGL